ncbi:MAG: hypothetical protein NZ959_01010 [Armatimonadetes bacterium]|nr:hypothetical protein [Armatimonadota bacterium]MDW8121908.1 hypothetical protein [Armatimonadota bacterium]
MKDRSRQWVIAALAVLVIILCGAIVFTFWQRGRPLPRPTQPDVGQMQKGMMEQMQRMRGGMGQ